MAKLAHQIAVQAALKTNDELAALFAKLGTTDAPRGRVLAAYRTARRALANSTNNLAVVVDTLGELRDVVEDVLADVLDDAVNVGLSQAERELRAYRLGAATVKDATDTTAALGAILASLDSQIERVKALAANDLADEATVLGDGTNAGILSPGAVIGEAAKWLGIMASATWTANILRATRGDESEFKRQAVAAIDERTTETCLLINGTVVGMDEAFPLQGEPWIQARRYGFSDKHLPFHWY